LGDLALAVCSGLSEKDAVWCIGIKLYLNSLNPTSGHNPNPNTSSVVHGTGHDVTVKCTKYKKCS